MNKELEPILSEYRTSLKEIRSLKHSNDKRESDNAKADASLISSMESDLEWTIEYMATGYMPAYSIGRYKKLVPVDPQVLASMGNKPLISNRSTNTERQELLDNLFKLLTENEQEALTLVVIEGLTYSEVAEILKVTKGSVSSYVKRAKHKIKQICKVQ